jgi:hypothetical protein
MPVKYTWLKILDVLSRRGSQMTVRDLKADLDSRGFYIDPKEFSSDLLKMGEAGFLRADAFTLTDGSSVPAADGFSRVGITPAGLRKLTMIVKI